MKKVALKIEKSLTILPMSMAWLCLLFASPASASVLFEISNAAEIDVKWRGQPLFISEGHDWLGEKSLAECADSTESITVQGRPINNIWSYDAPLRFRREIALTADGTEGELSFQAVQPGSYSAEYPCTTFNYYVDIPLSTLVNSSWEALCGRSFNAVWKKGELNSNTPDGDLIATTPAARWISFSTPKGDITFDFNPQSLPSYAHTQGDANTIDNSWRVVKMGDVVRLSFGSKVTDYKKASVSKMVIFEGNKEQYYNRHAGIYYHYFSEIPADRLFCFGAQTKTASLQTVRPAKKNPLFTDAAKMPFGQNGVYGWDRTKDLYTTGGELTGALYSGVGSGKPAVFKTVGLRQGLYLVTIRSSALGGNLGSFDISFNREIIKKGIRVPEGEVATLTFVRWIEGGDAQIAFSGGDWAVNVISFQMFMHSKSDLEFRRGFWIKNHLFCPDVMFSNYYDTTPQYNSSFYTQKLAYKVEEISSVAPMPTLKTRLPDPSSQEFEWRHRANIGTLGPDNSGSFDEYNTPEDIKRRLTELYDSGINTLIVNGLLSRHTFPEHLGRVQKNLADIVTEAHKLGMKIIDHQDLSVIFDMDMGFRLLAAHPDYLQRTVREGLPNWGMCPVNPIFKAHFFEYIDNHIEKTGIDGLLLDEVSFHGDNFCGCQYCRQGFTRDTGLTLPDDEISPILQNRESLLWKAWIEWRKNAIAQWRIDLRELTDKRDKNFCHIQYLSEAGLVRDAASYIQGSDLPLSAKSIDFLGTEIMSRDVWDGYRSNFALRKMYNSLHETYNSPVCGLVYPNGVLDYNIIGWAMNNMNGQSTWKLVGYLGDEKMGTFTSWIDNMNRRSAKADVEIATLFSRSTRDWSPKNRLTYRSEVLGTSQALNAAHVENTFILDDALLFEDLSRFRVMLAPGLECVSDEIGEKLRDYVSRGGVLFITGDALTFDQYGISRPKAVFADIIDFDRAKANNELGRASLGRGTIYYHPQRFGLNDCAPDLTLGQVYEFNPDKQTSAEHLRVLRTIVGERLNFESVNMPENVLTTVYSDVKEGAPIKMVHILNATGVEVKYGDTLPVPNPQWGTIDRDLVFEIAIPDIAQAYYATPDEPSSKSVGVERVEAGRYRVTVPRGTVHRYGIVYLYQNRQNLSK